VLLAAAGALDPADAGASAGGDQAAPRTHTAGDGAFRSRLGSSLSRISNRASHDGAS
jgi:hypothetical protein